ncbi:hypothetical protein Sme01_09160 [Sphaerisporangium melleum]|uniref:Fido domain-containing protein n=1 Tax=Sphaerisporangium melleum TaxID=321316 RepID=A0A917VEI6_9ACTN|nr:hypothetical protein GCM10007964_08450 [Sphaerisporangium melleum]GII68440.1 hypothetical protein Sme01_09160 [Sphaerisporangium melleum]
MVDLAAVTLGAAPPLRDAGLLDSAVRRPQASMFGHEAYPHLLVKAAALLHSLARHHPFERGARRVAWICTVVFLAWNGIEVDTGDDGVLALVTAVAAGALAEVDEIARVLWGFVARV